MKTIYTDDISEMTEIVYHLTTHGLTFEVFHKNGRWEIHLTGGF